MSFDEREFDEKYDQMQEYIPFVENVIQSIKKNEIKRDEVRLGQMEMLHEILTRPRRKVKMDTLLKCEKVLIKLKANVVPNKKFQKNNGHSWFDEYEMQPEMGEILEPDSPEQVEDYIPPVVIPTERKLSHPVICGNSNTQKYEVKRSRWDNLTRENENHLNVKLEPNESKIKNNESSEVLYTEYYTNTSIPKRTNRWSQSAFVDKLDKSIPASSKQTDWNWNAQDSTSISQSANQTSTISKMEKPNKSSSLNYQNFSCQKTIEIEKLSNKEEKPIVKTISKEFLKNPPLTAHDIDNLLHETGVEVVTSSPLVVCTETQATLSNKILSDNSKSLSLGSPAVKTGRIALNYNPHRRIERQLSPNRESNLHTRNLNADMLGRENLAYSLPKIPIKRLYHEVCESTNSSNNSFSNSVEDRFKRLKRNPNELFPSNSAKSANMPNSLHQTRLNSPKLKNSPKYRNAFSNCTEVQSSSNKSGLNSDRRSGNPKFNPILNDKTERLKYLESKKNKPPSNIECLSFEEFLNKPFPNIETKINSADNFRDRGQNDYSSKFSKRKGEKSFDELNPLNKTNYPDKDKKSDFKSSSTNSPTICDTHLDQMYRSPDCNGYLKNITGFKIPKKHSYNNTKSESKNVDENSKNQHKLDIQSANEKIITDLNPNTNVTSNISKEKSTRIIKGDNCDKVKSILGSLKTNQDKEFIFTKTIEAFEPVRPDKDISESEDTLPEVIEGDDWKVIDEVIQSSEEEKTEFSQNAMSENVGKSNKNIPTEKTIRRNDIVFDFTDDGCDLSLQNIIFGKRRSRTNVNFNELSLEAEQIRKILNSAEKSESKSRPKPRPKSRLSSRITKRTKKRKNIKNIKKSSVMKNVSDAVDSDADIKNSDNTDDNVDSNVDDNIDGNLSKVEKSSSDTTINNDTNKSLEVEDQQEDCIDLNSNETYQNFLKQIQENESDPSLVLEVLVKMLKTKNLTQEQFKNALNFVGNKNSGEPIPDESNTPNDPNIAKTENNTRSTSSSLKRSVKHKTELDRLNEDIRDMFISKDVIQATGRRSCTIMKNKPLPSSEEPQLANKKKPTQTLKKLVPFVSSKECYILPTLKKARVNVTRCPLISKILSLAYKKKKKNERNLHCKKDKPCPRSKKKYNYDSDVDFDNDLLNTTVASDDSIKMPILQPMEELEEPNIVSDATVKTILVNNSSLLNADSSVHTRSKYNNICVLCGQRCKHIAGHYLMVHNNSEVYPSRMAPDVLSKIQNNENNKPQYYINGSQKHKSFNFYCPFCNVENTTSISSWVQHFTTHTGEYPFRCSDCHRHANIKNRMVKHITLFCPSAKLISQPRVTVEYKTLLAYVCTLCNFTQFIKDNIIRHLTVHHSKTEYSSISTIIFMDFKKVPFRENEIIVENPITQDESLSQKTGESDSIEPVIQSKQLGELISTTEINADNSNDNTGNLRNKHVTNVPEINNKSINSTIEPLNQSKHMDAFISTETNEVNLDDNISNFMNNDDGCQLLNNVENVPEINTKPISTSIAERLSQRFKNLDENPTEPKTTVELNTQTIEDQNKNIDIMTILPSPLSSTAISEPLKSFANSKNEPSKDVIQEVVPSTSHLKLASTKHTAKNRLLLNRLASRLQSTDVLFKPPLTLNDNNSLEKQTTDEAQCNSNNIKNVDETMNETLRVNETETETGTETETVTEPVTATKSVSNLVEIIEIDDDDNWEDIEISDNTEKTSNSSTKSKNKQIRKSISRLVSNLNTKPVISQSNEKKTDASVNNHDTDKNVSSTCNSVSSCLKSLLLPKDKKESPLSVASTAGPADNPNLLDLQNSTDVVDVLNDTFKNATVPNAFIKNRISHFGFSVKDNEIRYHCLVNGCPFLYSELLVGLQNHYMLDHSNLIWDGYCYTCEAHVCFEDNLPLAREIAHMLEVHSKVSEPPLISNDDATAKNFISPKITLRRLSGDKLSSNQNQLVSTAQPNAGNILQKNPSALNKNYSKPNVVSYSINQLNPDDVGLKYVDEIDLTTEILNNSNLNKDSSSSSTSFNNSEYPFLKIKDVCSLNSKSPEPTTSNLRISEVISLSLHETNQSSNVLGGIPTVNRQILSNQPSIHPPRLPLSKLPMYLKAQLKEPALICKFKCMDDQCGFTTQFMKHIFEHLQKHSKLQTNHNMSWKQCPYCDYHAVSLTDYLLHADNAHKWDKYQCPYCFYRTAVDFNVVLHLRYSHPHAMKLILVCDTDNTNHKFDMNELQELQRKTIKRISCVDCKKTFYNFKSFQNHVKMHNPGLKFFECAHCHLLISIDYNEIKKHMLSTHQIGIYDCIYCSYATNIIENIKVHVAFTHPSNGMYSSTRLLPQNATIMAQCENEDLPVLLNLTCSVDSGLLKKFTPLDSTRKNLKKALLNSTVKQKNSLPSIPKENELIDSSKSPSPLLDKNKIEQCNSTNSIKNILRTTNTTTSLQTSTTPEDVVPIETESISKATAEVPTILELQNISETNEEITSTSRSHQILTAETSTKKSIKNLTIDDKKTDSEMDPTKENIEKTLNEIVAHTGLPSDLLYRCVFPDCKISLCESIFLPHIYHHISNGKRMTNFHCTHCNNSYKQANSLKSHLPFHARHQYFCYFCNHTGKSYNQQVKHIHETHSQTFTPYTYSIIPNRPNFFVIGPLNLSESDIVEFYQKLIADWKSKKSQLKKIFKPNEIDQLPIQPIFTNEVFCSDCNYKTKVKVNMIRHLNMHSREIFAAPVDPVNPVPRLNNQNTRDEQHVDVEKSIEPFSIATKIALKEVALNIPEYIPHTNRYVCGADGCQYQTISFNMLRCHLSTLHSTEKSYRCPHCKVELCKKTFCLERIIQHLRFHDSKLFQCESCNYLHYQRHVVLRHVRESHKGIQVNLITYDRGTLDKDVKISRTNATGNDQSESTNIESDDVFSIPNEIFNSRSLNSTKVNTKSKWLCNICKQQTHTYNQMISHTNNVHKCKNKYQCVHCTFNAPQLANIMDHINEIHPKNIREAKCIFNRVDEIEKVKATDTKPLWTRNDPSRIRHIRGILMEDEEEAKINAEKLAANNLEDDDDTQLIEEDDEEQTSNQKDNNQLNLTDGILTKINFLCFYCDSVYKTLDEVKEHWKSSHWLDTAQGYIPEVPFLFKIDGQMLCGHCRIFDGSRKQIIEHCRVEHCGLELAIVDKSNQNECAYCNYNWVDLNDLQMHAQNEHKPMNIKEFNFASLKEILTLGERQKFLQCYYCGQLCADKCNVLHHERVVHQNENIKCLRYKQIKDETIYLCKFCEYSSNHEMATIRHMIDHYPSFKECTNCDETFKNFTEYVQHFRKYHDSVLKKFPLNFNEKALEPFFAQIFVLFPNGLTMPKYSLIRTPYGWNDKIPAIYAEMCKRVSLDGSDKSLTPSKLVAVNQKPIKRRRKTIAAPFKFQNVDDHNNDECNPNNHIGTKRLHLSQTADNRDGLEYFSYYGKKPEEINLSKLHTTAHFSGSIIPVTCDRFSYLFNINAKVLVEKMDIPKNLELEAVFVKQTKPCPASKKFKLQTNVT